MPQSLSSAIVNLRASMDMEEISEDDAIVHLMTQFKLTRYGAENLLNNPHIAR